MQGQEGMEKLNMRRRILVVMLMVIVIAGMGVVQSPAETVTDYSGVWKQSNERCVPKRSGDVTMRIEQHGVEFTVETTMVRAVGAARHAVQRYTTDGKVSVSTGMDGDEFHTAIVWSGQNLVFSVEEHEDGKIILSKETWTLMENGTTLQRVRVGANGEKQIQIYLRQP